MTYCASLLIDVNILLFFKNGVRQKLLKLLSSKPDAGCPNVKVISKKCKNKKAKKVNNYYWLGDRTMNDKFIYFC